MSPLAHIEALLPRYQGVIRREEPMARHTAFKVGGACDLYLAPESLDDLCMAVATLSREGIPLIVVGGGSNLLVKDGGIEGAVITLAGLDTTLDEEVAGETVFLTVPAGIKTQRLGRFAAQKGYAGLNFTTGIPGTLGGALAMNAGTTPVAFEGILDALTVVDRSGEIHTVSRHALTLSYRHLTIGGKDRHDEAFPIIVSARLRLTRGTREALMTERKRLLKKRTQSQPVHLPSAGCFFKNPPQGPSAGKLIDDLGLKGETHGRAQVSPLHANYLVNTGGATAADIIALATRVKERVKRRHGIQLDEEVTLVGKEA